MHMNPETIIAVQIQEQVFVDTGKREKKMENKTIMCRWENWVSGGKQKAGGSKGGK